MALNYDTYLIARQMLIDAVSIPDYYMDYIDETVNLERYNKDCCPMHDERSPSFFYFSESGTFHCFGCGKTGGVTELHYHVNKRLDPSYTKVRALLDLSKLYDIKIPNLFEEAKLDVKQKFTSSSKLKFKEKSELRKPKKKVESDIEELIMKNRENMSMEDFKKFLNEMDEIFFLDSDVETRVNELEKSVMGKLVGGNGIEN